jgi:protoporphyrinogen oxidase
VIVVVGAGLTGLTVAHELAWRGLPVTVVERGPTVGGLARSFRVSGFTFDLGPHRFHTEDPGVLALVRAVLGEDALDIPRSSAVRAFGRTFAWPLGRDAFRALPLRVALGGALDLLRPRPPAGASFESDIVHRYGRTLYETFFRGYTERFLGIPPAELDADWARAGIDRAVIDRRARANALARLLSGALLPARVETTFLYPRQGMGEFAERLAARIAAAGGRVLAGREVTALEAEGDRVVAVRAGDERLAADGVVWTAPLPLAQRLLGLEPAPLELVGTVLHAVTLRAPASLGRQWVYYSDPDVPFVRASDPTRFSPASAPAGHGALCVERTCRPGDTVWRGAERDVPAVLRALVRVGALRTEGDVLDVRVERVPDTYPVYRLGYRATLREALASLRRWRNLLPAGRCGRFWYNNMDHSIAQGIRVAAGIAAGRDLRDVDVGERDYWAAGGDGGGALSLAPAPSYAAPGR